MSSEINIRIPGTEILLGDSKLVVNNRSEPILYSGHEAKLRLMAPHIVSAPRFDKEKGLLTMEVDILLPHLSGGQTAFNHVVNRYVSFTLHSGGSDSLTDRDRIYKLHLYFGLKGEDSLREGTQYCMYRLKIEMGNGLPLYRGDSQGVQLSCVKAVNITISGENPRTSRGTETVVQGG